MKNIIAKILPFTLLWAMLLCGLIHFTDAKLSDKPQETCQKCVTKTHYPRGCPSELYVKCRGYTGQGAGGGRFGMGPRPDRPRGNCVSKRIRMLEDHNGRCAMPRGTYTCCRTDMLARLAFLEH